jgi:DNA-binding FadR family transcriptional regulator
LKKLDKINAQLFQWMAAATHNKICQLVFNTLEKLVVELRPLVKVHPENLPRIQQILEQLVLAIEQQDEELAALLGERHTNLLRRVVRQFFEEYQSSSSRDPTKETPKEV